MNWELDAGNIIPTHSWAASPENKDRFIFFTNSERQQQDLSSSWSTTQGDYPCLSGLVAANSSHPALTPYFICISHSSQTLQVCLVSFIFHDPMLSPSHNIKASPQMFEEVCLQTLVADSTRQMHTRRTKHHRDVLEEQQGGRIAAHSLWDSLQSQFLPVGRCGDKHISGQKQEWGDIWLQVITGGSGNTEMLSLSSGKMRSSFPSYYVQKSVPIHYKENKCKIISILEKN